MKKLLVMYSVIFFVQPLSGVHKEPTVNATKALLIFLDDAESDDVKNAAERIGIITNKFITAFSQQAGPIIVSASVIDNARLKEKPAETDVQKRIERYNNLESNVHTLNDAEAKEMKNIIRSFVAFDKETAEQWIIKKITPELYLLMPKAYLMQLGLTFESVALYTKTGPITAAEQQLGLKVNHMPTVADINTIKKPLPEPHFAAYFIDALQDKGNNGSSGIFVTNREYYALGNKNIPAWSVLIVGHGLMDKMIAGLSLAQFRDFLAFLELKIHTKLLYYWSCYAAGINAQELYRDAKDGVEKTYAFPIITHAITDAPVTSVLLQLTSKNGKPHIIYSEFYDTFVNLVTTSDIIDFKKVMACFFEMLQFLGVESILPQIKLPGLPWFQVIHDERFCSIGSILAKARTKPLDIGSFFARRGKKAAPMAILIYPQDIPFELIINTKNELDLPPTMISMIPGNATHHIKRISSAVHSANDLVDSFMRIELLGPHKTFIIDEIVSKKKGEEDALCTVIIELTPKQNNVYDMENGKVFKNGEPMTRDDDIAHYAQLRKMEAF